MLIITSWDKMTSCRIEKKMGHFFNSDPESTLLPKRRYVIISINVPPIRSTPVGL